MCPTFKDLKAYVTRIVINFQMPRLDRDGMGRTWNNRWHTGARVSNFLGIRGEEFDLSSIFLFMVRHSNAE